MLSAAPRASLTLPSCSPNYPRASRIGWTLARYCPFLNYFSHDRGGELMFVFDASKSIFVTMKILYEIHFRNRPFPRSTPVVEEMSA